MDKLRQFLRDREISYKDSDTVNINKFIDVCFQKKGSLVETTRRMDAGIGKCTIHAIDGYVNINSIILLLDYYPDKLSQDGKKLRKLYEKYIANDHKELFSDDIDTELRSYSTAKSILGFDILDNANLLGKNVKLEGEIQQLRTDYHKLYAELCDLKINTLKAIAFKDEHIDILCKKIKMSNIIDNIKIHKFYVNEKGPLVYDIIKEMGIGVDKKAIIDEFEKLNEMNETKEQIFERSSKSIRRELDKVYLKNHEIILITYPEHTLIRELSKIIKYEKLINKTIDLTDLNNTKDGYTVFEKNGFKATVIQVDEYCHIAICCYLTLINASDYPNWRVYSIFGENEKEENDEEEI